MKMSYGWVKNASKQEHEEMGRIIERLNEEPFDFEYKKERASDCWVIGVYYKGRRVEAGSFVRCGTCRRVRELFDGQIEFCTDCGVNWN